jgi:hypothetical protein
MQDGTTTLLREMKHMIRLCFLLCWVALTLSCQAPPHSSPVVIKPSSSSEAIPQPLPLPLSPTPQESSKPISCNTPCLSGIFVDYQGTPLSNVKVTLSSLNEALPEKVVVSNLRGEYFIENIPENSYFSMSLEKAGFYPHERVVSLNNGESSKTLNKKIDITLKSLQKPPDCYIINCIDSNTLMGKLTSVDDSFKVDNLELTLKSQEEVVTYEVKIKPNLDGSYSFEKVPANIRMEFLINNDNYEPLSQNIVLKEKLFGKELFDIVLVPKSIASK